VPIEEYENNAYRRVAKGYRNPRRVRDAMLRWAFLTLAVVLWYPILFVWLHQHVNALLLGYFLIVLTIALLYLLACDPLPPCAGKVRAWLRGVALSRVAVPESPGPTRIAVDLIGGYRVSCEARRPRRRPRVGRR